MLWVLIRGTPAYEFILIYKKITYIIMLKTPDIRKIQILYVENKVYTLELFKAILIFKIPEDKC